MSRDNLIYLTIILVPILAVACARGSKALGQQIAVTFLTKVDSVIETINKQVRVFGGVWLLAIILFAALLALVIFVPMSETSLAVMIGSMIGFATNLALGFAAGVGNNLTEGILAKPAIRDGIDCLMDMKRRLRGHLQKFLSVMLLALSLGAGFWNPAHAGDGVWIWAIDVTESMDPVQREAAIGHLIDSSFDVAQSLGVDVIQIIRFDEEVMLSDSVWVSVPRHPTHPDCRTAKAAPMRMEGLIGFSPVLAAGMKRKAVEDCLAGQRVERESEADRVRSFRKQLEAATRITPQTGVRTRIVPLLQWLVNRVATRAITVVTDGIDTSGIPVEKLRIPERLDVTFIVTRPNPKRTNPTLDEVLAAAKAWARVEGVTVVSVGEYPGLMANSGCADHE